MGNELNNLAHIFFKDFYFYFLGVNFLLILALFVKRRAAFFDAFKDLNKFHLLLVFIAFLTALYFRSHYFRDGIAYKFFTEQFSVANSFYYYKQAFICNAGRFSACDSSIAPIHPGGFAFLVYLFFLIFGNSFSAYTLCAALISSLTIVAVYFLAILLLKDSKAGVVASFIFTFLSEHIRITETRAVIAASILFVIISIITLLVYLKNQKDSELCLLSFLTLFFSANIRYENIILLFVFFVAYYLYRKIDWNYSMVFKNLFISSLISLPLLIMHLVSQDALSAILGKESVIGGSFDKLFLNIDAYCRYLSSGYYFYQPLYLFLLLGIFILLFKTDHRKVSVVIFSWAIVYSIAYLFHKNIGYHRYAMHLFPQYTLLISLGVSSLIGGIYKLILKIHNFRFKVFIPNLLLAISIMLISFKLLGLIPPARTSEAVDYSEILNEVNENDYVILDDTNSMVFLDHNFIIFNYHGYNKKLLLSKLNQGSEVYLLVWKGMCQHYQRYRAHCDIFFSDFPFIELKKLNKYTLYKVDRSQLGFY